MESSGAAASLPVTVAGFTPTVARIAEQNSLEIVESLSSDNVAAETAPLQGGAAAVKPAAAPTVPDVVYDEHGQTWDVYGAEFDPVILGQAIQTYLEKIMARKLTGEDHGTQARGRGGTVW